jgi:PhnB protein
MPGDQSATETGGNRLMHISLPIGNRTVLMGSDSPEGGHMDAKIGDNFFLSLSPDSTEEADRIFNALSAGGKVLMPMAKQFWGSYFGMLTDKFSINWMVSFDGEQQ